MKKHKTFTEFLGDKHANQYTGLDDEMPDDFEAWLSGLDVNDLIDYADKHATETSERALENAFERFQELKAQDKKLNN